MSFIAKPPTSVVAGVALLVVVAGGASAFTVLTASEGNSSDAPLDAVPSGADAVVVVDGEIVTHETTRTAYKSAFERFSTEQNRSYEQYLASIENQSSVDPRKVHHVVAYWKYPDAPSSSSEPRQYQEPDGGVILESNYSNDEVLTALNSSRFLPYREAGTYNGTTVYATGVDYEWHDRSFVADLGNGTFAFAENETVLHEIVDTEAGDASGFTGSVRESLTDRPDSSLVYFASSYPDDAFGARPLYGPMTGTISGNVEVMSGAYYPVNDRTVGLTVTLESSGESEASDVYESVDGAMAAVREGVSNETIASSLENIDVSQSGSSVTVTYEDSIRNIADAMTAVQNTGRDEPEVEKPTVDVRFEYDAKTDELTVVHESGESLIAENLYYNAPKTGIAEVPFSGEEFAAGDEFTISDIESDAYVNILWTAGDDHGSVGLSTFYGPDAER